MSFNPKDFLRLAKLQKQPDFLPLEREVVEVLEYEWEILSLAYARLDPGARLEPASFPGYLVAEDTNWRFYVPWPLVTSFPTAEVCAALFEVGQEIAISPLRNLCLSGSSASVGSKIEIGDLDFCQYVEIPPAQIVLDAERFISPTDRRMLTQAGYGATCIVPPWSNSWTLLREQMERAVSVDGAERFMTEFLGLAPGFGLLPISNVVLASNFADRSRGAASQSYVYQEAVAVPLTVEIPPWTLVDANQIGAYVNFLREQIGKFADDKPLKAIKRALSLAHTIRLQDYVSEALDILLSEEAAAYIRYGQDKGTQRPNGAL